MNAVSCQPNEGGVTPVKSGDSSYLTPSSEAAQRDKYAVSSQ